MSALVVACTGSGVAFAHGGGSEMEMKGLAMQPARTLAQQALVELRVRHDTKEAAVRLDAALESKQGGDIDRRKLRQAMESVDSGHDAAAMPLLDEPLSRPLGASSGKALHAAGREFQPATGAQEIVAIALGGFLLALGALALLRSRRVAGRA
jgi:LPXTG-motif cell wall-anchored protein